MIRGEGREVVRRGGDVGDALGSDGSSACGHQMITLVSIVSGKISSGAN